MEIEPTPELGWFLERTVPHHPQGVLDGACGLCCLAMVLDYLGLAAPREDVFDRRRSFSRFLHRVFGRDILLLEGSTAKQIQKAQSYFRNRLQCDPIQLGRDQAANHEAIRRAVADCKRPAMVEYSCERDAHWVVVAGAAARWDRKPTLFVMCPALPATLDFEGGTLFNDYLRLQGPKHGWRNSAGDTVKIREAIAFSLA